MLSECTLSLPPENIRKPYGRERGNKNEWFKGKKNGVIVFDYLNQFFNVKFKLFK